MTTPQLFLSRTLDPQDYTQLERELALVDRHGIEGQHPHRRWEYALALRAVQRWMVGNQPGEPLYDVGGAGSTFARMLTDWTGCRTTVIDPQLEGSCELADACRGGTPLGDVVTCLSVIEHVDVLPEFLYHLSCLVAPGGLLVLTMDYWNRCGKDTAANHDLRQRIFCPKTYAALRTTLQGLQLTTFGGFDPTFHGSHVHDYTFASLVLEKRR